MQPAAATLGPRLHLQDVALMPEKQSYRWLVRLPLPGPWWRLGRDRFASFFVAGAVPVTTIWMQDVGIVFVVGIGLVVT